MAISDIIFRISNQVSSLLISIFLKIYLEYFRIVAAAFIAADVDLCNDALEEIFGRRHG